MIAVRSGIVGALGEPKGTITMMLSVVRNIVLRLVRHR
jgi:hypothetical protein